jgi:hypothetical protein
MTVIYSFGGIFTVTVQFCFISYHRREVVVYLIFKIVCRVLMPLFGLHLLTQTRPKR